MFSSKTTPRSRIESDESTSSPSEDTLTTASSIYGKNMLFRALIISLACFSVLSAVLFETGYYTEYHTPLTLMKIPFSGILILFSILTIAVFATFLICHSVEENKTKHPLKSCLWTSYFLSAMTTLAVTVYIGALLIHVIKGGFFPFEAFYILALYVVFFILHFIAGKSALFHNMISLGFVITLLATSYYAGLASARANDKMIASIAGETYALVEAQHNRLVFSGYERQRERFNDKFVLLTPAEGDRLSYTSHPPVRR